MESYADDIDREEYYDDIKLPLKLIADAQEAWYGSRCHPSSSRPDHWRLICCSSCVREGSDSEDETSNKKIYECPHCGLRFLLSIALKYHIKGSHGPEQFYQCSYCSFNSHILSQVRRHVREAHTSEKRHCCPHCKYKAKRSTHLRRHIEARHDINRPPKRHYTIKHEIDDEPGIACAQAAVVDDEEEKPLLCSECGYTTMTQRSLKRHIKSAHDGNAILHKCEQCDFGAGSLRELRHHIKVEHEKAKCFECPCCPYRTVHLGSLKNHIMAKHTDEKCHKCPYCNYRAVQSGNLKRHIRTKHPNKRNKSRKPSAH